MKKIISLLLILCLVISLAACGNTNTQPDASSANQTEPNQTNSQTTPGTEAPDKGSYYSLASGVTAQFMEAPTPGTEPTAPEEPQIITSDTSWVHIGWDSLNIGEPEIIQNADETTRATVYPHTEEPIQATFSFSRYISPKNLPAEDYSYAFMILADGAPVEFTVKSQYKSETGFLNEDEEPIDFTEDGQTYLQYPLSVGEDHVYLDLEFQPKFDLNLGRLDFIAIFTGNDTCLYPINGSTIWIAQEGDPIQPDMIVEGVDSSSPGSLAGNYTHCLNDQYSGITLPQSSDVTYDVSINEVGMFRTLVFYNYRPLAFTIDGKDYSTLDWESNGDQMLEVPLKLPETSGDKATISFYAMPIRTLEDISTNANPNAVLSRASASIVITFS